MGIQFHIRLNTYVACEAVTLFQIPILHHLTPQILTTLILLHSNFQNIRLLILGYFWTEK